MKENIFYYHGTQPIYLTIECSTKEAGIPDKIEATFILKHGQSINLSFIKLKKDPPTSPQQEFESRN